MRVHRVIVGTTGSGKTTLALLYFMRSPTTAIFVNTTAVSAVDVAADVRTTKATDTLEAIKRPKTKVSYTPDRMDRETARAEVDYLSEKILELGQQARSKGLLKEGQFWLEVFLDEAWIYAPKASEKSPVLLWTHGRGLGIRATAISQRPANTSHEILTQSNPHYVFALGRYERPYFERYGIDLDRWAPILRQRYHFLEVEMEDTSGPGHGVTPKAPIHLPKSKAQT